MPPHLDRLAGFLAVTAALALAAGCGDDDDGGSEFGSGGNAGTGTGGSGNIGGLAGSGGTGGSSGSPDGGDAAAGSGGSGGDCTGYGQGDCAICLDQSCCAEAAACEKSSSCSGMVECARACPDPTDANSACVKDCASQHQLGGSEYNPLMLCMGNACGSVCPYL